MQERNTTKTPWPATVASIGETRREEGLVHVLNDTTSIWQPVGLSTPAGRVLSLIRYRRVRERSSANDL
jgi:hypothetical protein